MTVTVVDVAGRTDGATATIDVAGSDAGSEGNAADEPRGSAPIALVLATLGTVGAGSFLLARSRD